MSISTILNSKYVKNDVYLEDYIADQKLAISHVIMGGGIPQGKTPPYYHLKLIDITNIQN